MHKEKNTHNLDFIKNIHFCSKYKTCNIFRINSRDSALLTQINTCYKIFAYHHIHLYIHFAHVLNKCT